MSGGSCCKLGKASAIYEPKTWGGWFVSGGGPKGGIWNILRRSMVVTGSDAIDVASVCEMFSVRLVLLCVYRRPVTGTSRPG